MALANLKKELEDILAAIRRPQGGDSGDDPLRKLFDKVPADFELEKSFMIKELKLVQQRAPETGKYGGALYSEFGSAKDDKKLEEFALAWIAQFKIEVQKKSSALEVRFKINSSDHLLVTVVFKAGTSSANVYNFFRTRQKQTREALTATGKYNEVLSRASKSNKGEEIFNIGHHTSVAESRLSVFTSMAVKAGAESGAFDHLEDKGRSIIVKTVETSLEKLQLEVEIEDNLEIYLDKDGALQGSTTVKYDAESWFKNQVLRQEESAFGVALTSKAEKNSVINLLSNLFKEEAQKKLVGQSSSAFAKRKGSKSLEENALAVIINNPTMRAAYSRGIAKNLSKIKYSPQQRTNKTSSPLKIKGKRKNYKVNGGNKILPPKPKKTGQVESGTNEMMRKAFETRAFVNSRIAKTVQGNMGRPALENQTGRFAKSVQVTNAMSVGNQIHMDYTYNPNYRVFENGSQYTSNFDPRPLIEKSIRELAAARLETKFTLRRV